MRWEIGWVLENNVIVQNIFKKINAKLYKNIKSLSKNYNLNIPQNLGVNLFYSLADASLSHQDQALQGGQTG